MTTEHLIQADLDYKRHKILEDIQNERALQDIKWGRMHDSEHTPEEWIGFIHEHSYRALTEDFRKQMIRVAALAVAAIEAQP
jgi:hypothetical protein